MCRFLLWFYKIHVFAKYIFMVPKIWVKKICRDFFVVCVKFMHDWMQQLYVLSIVWTKDKQRLNLITIMSR